MSDHAAAAYRAPNPLNQAQDMQQLVEDMAAPRREMRRDMTQLQRSMNQRFDHVDEQFRCNERARTMNRWIARCVANDIVNRGEHLHAFLRVDNQDGQGFLIRQPAFVPPAPINPGDPTSIPRLIFPLSLAAIARMTRVMNDDFGIQANDTTAECRLKLRRAITDPAERNAVLVYNYQYSRIDSSIRSANCSS